MFPVFDAPECQNNVFVRCQLSICGVPPSVCKQGPYGVLKVLKSLEFDWSKFKDLKSLNLI